MSKGKSLWSARTAPGRCEHGRWSNAFSMGFAFTVSQLFPRHVFKSKKVLVFGAMEDIKNDKYLARS